MPAILYQAPSAQETGIKVSIAACPFHIRHEQTTKYAATKRAMTNSEALAQQPR